MLPVGFSRSIREWNVQVEALLARGSPADQSRLGNLVLGAGWQASLSESGSDKATKDQTDRLVRHLGNIQIVMKESIAVMAVWHA